MSVSKCRHLKLTLGSKNCPECGKPFDEAFNDQCKEITDAIIKGELAKEGIVE